MFNSTNRSTPSRRRQFIGFTTFSVLFIVTLAYLTKTMASSETFWRLGHNITKHDIDGSIALGYRKFRSFFGTSPSVCGAAYDNLSHVRPVKSRPEHLLWTLLHLKHYATEHISAALVGVSAKTFRKWCHIFIRLLAKMPVV
jgi:hypothetical protein